MIAAVVGVVVVVIAAAMVLGRSGADRPDGPPDHVINSYNSGHWFGSCSLLDDSANPTPKTVAEALAECRRTWDDEREGELVESDFAAGFADGQAERDCRYRTLVVSYMAGFCDADLPLDDAVSGCRAAWTKAGSGDEFEEGWYRLGHHDGRAADQDVSQMRFRMLVFTMGDRLPRHGMLRMPSLDPLD